MCFNGEPLRRGGASTAVVWQDAIADGRLSTLAVTFDPESSAPSALLYDGVYLNSLRMVLDQTGVRVPASAAAHIATGVVFDVRNDRGDPAYTASQSRDSLNLSDGYREAWAERALEACIVAPSTPPGTAALTPCRR